MRRVSFLTVFFAALGAVFVIALVLRIRSFQNEAPQVPVTVTSSVPAPLTTSPSATSPPMIGTVEPVSSRVSGPASQPRSASTTRSELREKLLREPLSVAPATPTTTTTAAAPKPVIAPRPAAVTAAPPRPQPQPQPRLVNMPPSAVQQRMAAAAAATGSGSPSSATTTAPKDPNSDTAPPQLMAVDFDPPQVHDGEEARVIMTAVDDLSGVRGISGTITSPTGKALQGFAGLREGETNRYVGRFTVPKNGEEGLWRVNVITMSDNASNSTTLSLAQGTLPPNAGLRVVSSQSDSTPPVLKSARTERRSMHIGEPNPLYIEADDDKSGVHLVSAVFQSPNKKARIGAGCTKGEGEIWKCELSLPQCIDCGDWQLEQVTLQDNANNLATFRLDNPIVAAVKINIAGESCDSDAPRLQRIALDQTVVNMSGQPTAVSVSLTVTDDACGVEGASVQYAGPGTGTGGFVPMQRAGDDQTWVGRIPLDPRAPRGAWRITSVQVTDKGHNLRIYYANDPLLANATFQVR